MSGKEEILDGDYRFSFETAHDDVAIGITPPHEEHHNALQQSAAIPIVFQKEKIKLRQRIRQRINRKKKGKPPKQIEGSSIVSRHYVHISR